MNWVFRSDWLPPNGCKDNRFMAVYNVFYRIVAFITGVDPFLGLLWLGLAALSIALLALAHTRWGQSRPLRKCFILSLLAHLLLAGYATTVTIVSTCPATSGEPVIHIRLGEAELEKELVVDEQDETDKREKPWEEFVHGDIELAEAPLPEPLERPSEKTALSTLKAPSAKPDNMPAVETASHEPRPFDLQSAPSRQPKARAPEPISVPSPQRRTAAMPGLVCGEGELQSANEKRPKISSNSDPLKRPEKAGVSTSLLRDSLPLPRIAQLPAIAETADSLAALADAPSKTTHGRPVDNLIAGPAEARQPAGELPDGQAVDNLNNKNGKNGEFIPVNNTAGPPRILHQNDAGENAPMPHIYRLRVDADRSSLAIRNGATAETEAAVRAALKWLAENQNHDGRWQPAKHQGGRELRVAGRDRLNAGIKADTAVTGLALLAMLASGHTHEEGLYQDNVRRGMEFLLAQQKPDGSLSGHATHYAAMYCHAMAAFALSEAYAMTHDSRLREPVGRAVEYTLAAQDPAGGGWRYMPGDPGDTSQFGWQLMTLKSAELAGIPIPIETRRRMLRFIKSVSSGRHLGLAAYRPDQPYSRSMTAEAMTCRQFLGMPPAGATGLEAGDYIIGLLPGEGRTNYYYWYYATIALYQLQGDHWQRWNQALQTTLVQSQRKNGPQAGSWDPNSTWGGYGGRVYSTALAALCLEVYYRYLPMYVEAAAAQQRLR